MTKAKLNVSALARAAGLKPALVHNRLYAGMSLEDALSSQKYARRPVHREDPKPILRKAPEPITLPPLTQKSPFRWGVMISCGFGGCAAAALLGFFING